MCIRDREYPDHYAVIKAYESLLDEKKEVEEKLSVASEQIAKFEHAEFVSEAKKLIASSKISKEIGAEFSQKCESGEIASLEDLRVKVAMALLEQNMAAPAEESAEEVINENTGVEVSFSAPVSAPDTSSVFASKEDSKKNSMSSWDRLRDYTGK